MHFWEVIEYSIHTFNFSTMHLLRLVLKVISAQQAWQCIQIRHELIAREKTFLQFAFCALKHWSSTICASNGYWKHPTIIIFHNLWPTSLSHSWHFENQFICSHNFENNCNINLLLMDFCFFPLLNQFLRLKI